MTMAGVMERHPGLRVLLAHGGGALLALRGRLRHAHSFQREARAELARVAARLDPALSLRHRHPRRRRTRALVDLAGPERVLLGSDYPFDMADGDPVGACAHSGWRRAEAAVLADNARRLVGSGVHA